MKKCFKCKITKSIEAFYKHPEMADGHFNKCKYCTKKDVKKRYDDPSKRGQIIEYEKLRSQNPNRKNKQLEYQRKRRRLFKGKYKCRNVFQYAIRKGVIKKEVCKVCKDPKVEGHHVDYRSPLKVIWLCRKHHLEIEGKIPF